MNNWPKYESHKIVQAAKIVGIEYDTETSKRTIWVRPAGEKYDSDGINAFEPTVPGMGDKAVIGDWAMLYTDGFKSISPAKAFEEGYTRVPD